MADFLLSSFRPSSRSSYTQAWKVWRQWCASRGLDLASPAVGLVLEYLLHLVEEKGMAYTVGLHRSAISSLAQPSSSSPIGQHPLISRFMRAVFQHRSPAHKTMRPTWDVEEVLNTIRGWGPTHQLDWGQLARRTLVLVAVGGGVDQLSAAGWLFMGQAFRSSI